MNKILKYMVIAVMLFISLSCQKQELLSYREQAGVYFQEYSSKFSFAENPDKVQEGFVILNIPVKISGSSIAKDRTFKAHVYDEDKLYDEVDRAEQKMFSIGEGLVRAENYSGFLPLKINYTPEMDTKEYTVYIIIESGEDFPVTDLNGTPIKVTFGNIYSKPENWDSKLKRYFGEYSNSWYQQILLWTKLKSLPYKYSMGAEQPNISAEEAKRWPMPFSEMKVYAFMVKEMLIEYNNTHPGDEMKHKDGIAVNTKVTMGSF